MQQRMLTAALLLIVPVVALAQAKATSYVHATQLNLRSEPGAGTVQELLSLNTPLILKRKEPRWCEVQTVASERRGYVDCSFLGDRPLTMEQVELDLANASLELARLRKDGQIFGSGLASVEPQQAARMAERLLTLLERHFALSPSLHTYGDYQNLLRVMMNSANAEDKSHPLTTLANTRVRQLETMRAALSFDPSARSLPVVRNPATTTLALALDRRNAASPRREARRAQAIARLTSRETAPAQRASFFQQGAWATGWAGGPLVSRLPGHDPAGVVYSVTFDGAGAWVLADLLEMAKVHRSKVSAQFGDAGIPKDSLSQATVGVNGSVDSLVLKLRLPVWGITAGGLVAGTLRTASYGGDACSGATGSKVPTSVEVVFPQAVRGDLHGVFASSAPIDPARAVVTVRKRTFLAPLLSDETTFTHRVDMSVDLDSDGVADLRTTVSNDTSVSGVSIRRGPEHLSRWIRPVGGWYANDVYALEMNEEGWWRVLSLYNLVTCT